MAQEKYDVVIDEHDEWEIDALMQCTQQIVGHLNYLVTKLKPSAEDRESLLRQRLLLDTQDSQIPKFAKDHPRMFKLVTSEGVFNDKTKMELIYMTLFVKQKVRNGEISDEAAKEQMIKLSRPLFVKQNAKGVSIGSVVPQS